MKNLTVVCLSIAFGIHAQNSSGTVTGTVTASGTLTPVPGAFVVAEGTSRGGITDSRGEFFINDLPPGGYVLRITSVGFHPRALADVIVRPGRITALEISLEYSVLEGGVIHVTPDYFSDDPDEPVSRIQFSGEQIRRSPGSAGDVSRVVAALPAVAKVDDQYNGMAVRGGNPMENGVYVDGMRVPNINHFPRQGTSGGGLGLINTDLIRDVKFSAGGFSPSFGDRLSSVMEIEIRDGNREEFDGQVDLNMSGFGAVLEGPLGENSSWLVCGRRSFIDMLVDIADIDAVPVYSDFQGKAVFDLSSSHRISFSVLGAKDFVDYSYEQAFEDGNDNYGITENWNVSTGLSWRWIWPGSGFSNTTLSYSGIDYFGEYYETLTEEVQALQNSTENSVSLRNVNTWQPVQGLSLEFGLESTRTMNSFDNYYAGETGFSGEPIPPLTVNRRINGYTAGLFGSGSVSITDEIILTAGGRADHSETTGRTHFSPRGSFIWEPYAGTAISAAAGVYRQDLPSELTSRGPDFLDLDVPRSIHGVTGIRYLLNQGTRLRVEGYIKTGSGFPFDPSQPGYFILDGVSSEQDLYSFETLNSGGETRAYGIEGTLQKQLINGLYGLVAASASVSEYRNPGQVWRRRIYDNRWTGTVEGGYRFGSGWEVSCRWLTAGGRPYTPLDIQASELLNRTVLDSTRINGERYPLYSSLNIRADRRFHFQRSSLVCYLSVWNILNRRNVTATYWNRIENKEDYIYQWAMMPVFGIEYEF